MQPLRVLIIDDEKNIRTTLGMCLEAEECRVKGVGTIAAAMNAIGEESYDLAFLDLRLGQADGLAFLPEILARCPDLSVIVITAFATFETAVEAIKRGAWDYLPKPFTPDQIRILLQKARERLGIRQRLANLENLCHDSFPEAQFETASPAMRKALDVTKQVAASQTPVLFRGENGTGKTLFARLLHAQSPRSARPFITVNCPILQENLLASELFGHAKGSFTGAVRDQVGKVEAADGGTLFLDEIGEMPIAVQAQLLRFLQDRQFERVGENRTRRADTRVVCATNRNLEEDVKAGRFREDLLFRINVMEIAIPALRDRHEDILPLAWTFLAFFARNLGRPCPEFSKATADLVMKYSWPGNVRELRNTVERALILCPARVIEPSALPERFAGPSPDIPHLGADFTLEMIERAHIQLLLKRVTNLEEAATILGIDSSTLWRKRKKFGEDL